MSATLASKLTRRGFLKSGAAGSAALVIGFYWPTVAIAQDEAKPNAGKQEEKPVNPVNAWLRIDRSGNATLICEKAEMGQGILTSMAMILAEELAISWDKVSVEHAATDPKTYPDLGTGGSSSVRESWTPLRQAGAAAREMLISAAALHWHVDRAECKAENGTVVHGPNSRHLTYGELVTAAAKLPVPDLEDVPLRNSRNFRVIGKSVPRVDTPSKTDGSAQYGIDVKVPGMLYALVARCPAFGGKVASFRADKAKAIPGVRHVVEIPAIGPGAFSAGGVAVVGDTTYAAMQGRDALEIQWDNGPDGSDSSEALRQRFEELIAKPGKTLVKTGDVDSALGRGAKKVEAVYEVPFLAHATMEPMNCTVDIRADRAEVWAPTQGPVWIRDTVAHIAGLKPEAVTVHTTLMGGAFGRRYQADFAAEAAQISKAVGAPVKLLWTREDDMQHDFYRPASVQKLSGAVDSAGTITAWNHRLTSTSIRAFWDPPEKAKPEESEIGEASAIPYLVENFRLEYANPKSGVPVAWWRSVENSMNGFTIESFIDELAAAAGIDPLEFRIRAIGPVRKVKDPADPETPPLDTARIKAALELAANKAGWSTPLPKGSGRGIACYFSFHTYAAEVAEVTFGPKGGLRVDRVVCAVDCGRALNPDGVRAQVESAVVYGLSAVLHGEITIKDGAVVQTNFNNYPVLRMKEMPVVEVHIVPSTADPTGIGEPALPPLAAAVANAIYAANGKRIRRLPIRNRDLA